MQLVLTVLEVKHYSKCHHSEPLHGDVMMEVGSMNSMGRILAGIGGTQREALQPQ